MVDDEADGREIELGLKCDLLLADFALPDMNDVELAHAVRALRPSFPVVFFTGGDVERIAGQRWVLMKPFIMRTLIDTLHAALGQTQGTDAALRSNTRAV
jgi:DNA-binding response OmpR family regulator